MAFQILLVDDFPLFRQRLRRLLTAPDFVICGEASTGNEALERTRALKPDLVLMDLSMPEMNGIEVTRQIRQISPKTRIVVVTLHDSPKMSVLAKQAGADAYVVKSGRTAELIETVHSVLGV